jgi:hypothetical protein
MAESERKPFFKQPLYMILIGVVFIGAYIVFSPPDNTAPKVKRKLTSSTKNKASDQFTEEDTNAKFLPIPSRPADAFKPLIVRHDITGLSGTIPGGIDSTPGNSVPAAFADGDRNWTYTGTAEVDSVPMVLIENKTTLEGVYLKHGQRWKKAVVERITPNSVVLAGPGGSKELTLVSDEEPKPGTGTVRPMQVPSSALQGTIGVQPVNPATAGGNPGSTSTPGVTQFGVGGQ